MAYSIIRLWQENDPFYHVRYFTTLLQDAVFANGALLNRISPAQASTRNLVGNAT